MTPAGISRRPMLPWNLSLAVSKASGVIARATGRGGGTTLPGRVLLRLRPDALTRLRARIPLGSVVVSSTNGKTTTAAMIASILEREGREVVHNKAGSNMHWGVASALLEAPSDGAPRMGLFEIDEAWVSSLVSELDPQVVVLGNLFRDQLDRYGELERLADEWAAMAAGLPTHCRVALCADDPSVADLALALPDGVEVLRFGIEDATSALEAPPHASDPKYCRSCGSRYSFSAHFVGHLGTYECPECHHARPDPDLSAESIRLEGLEGSRFLVTRGDESCEVELPLPGLYNVYNALGALSAAVCLQIPLRRAVKGLEATSAVFGRSEVITVGETRIALLLVKNPTGANEVLRTLADQAEREGALDLWLGLNDRIADGRDVSWIWDADFEVLSGHTGRVTCAGDRAAEMALRLKYAGWPTDGLTVEPDPEKSLLSAAKASSGSTLYALPTYTALLEIRRDLAGKGHADEFWA